MGCILEAIFWILEGLPTTLAGEWVAGRKKKLRTPPPPEGEGQTRERAELDLVKKDE
jgi:hypothetical protein